MIITLYFYFVLSHFYIKLYYNFMSLFSSSYNIIYHIFFILLYYCYLIFLFFFIYEFYFLSNLNLSFYLFFYDKLYFFYDKLYMFDYDYNNINKIKINPILYFTLYYYKIWFRIRYNHTVDYLKIIKLYFKVLNLLIKEQLIRFINKYLIKFIDKSFINIKKFLIKKFYKPKIEIIFILRNKKLRLSFYYHYYIWKLKNISNSSYTMLRAPLELHLDEEDIFEDEKQLIEEKKKEKKTFMYKYYWKYIISDLYSFLSKIDRYDIEHYLSYFILWIISFFKYLFRKNYNRLIEIKNKIFKK